MANFATEAKQRQEVQPELPSKSVSKYLWTLSNKTKHPECPPIPEDLDLQLGQWIAWQKVDFPWPGAEPVIGLINCIALRELDESEFRCGSPIYYIEYNWQTRTMNVFNKSFVTKPWNWACTFTSDDLTALQSFVVRRKCDL